MASLGLPNLLTTAVLKRLHTANTPYNTARETKPMLPNPSSSSTFDAKFWQVFYAMKISKKATDNMVN